MLEKLIQILLLDNHLLITMKEDEEIKSYQFIYCTFIKKKPLDH